MAEDTTNTHTFIFQIPFFKGCILNRTMFILICGLTTFVLFALFTFLKNKQLTRCAITGYFRRVNLDNAQSQSAEPNLSPSSTQMVTVGLIPQIKLTY